MLQVTSKLVVTGRGVLGSKQSFVFITKAIGHVFKSLGNWKCDTIKGHFRKHIQGQLLESEAYS